MGQDSAPVLSWPFPWTHPRPAKLLSGFVCSQDLFILVTEKLFYAGLCAKYYRRGFRLVSMAGQAMTLVHSAHRAQGRSSPGPLASKG